MNARIHGPFLRAAEAAAFSVMCGAAAAYTFNQRVLIDGNSVELDYATTPSLLDISGNPEVDYGDMQLSAGAYLRTGSGTINNKTMAGTKSNDTFAINSLNKTTLTATYAITYGDAATLWIAGAPSEVVGGNITMTGQNYAMYVKDNVLFNGSRVAIGGTHGNAKSWGLTGEAFQVSNITLDDTSISGTVGQTITNHASTSFSGPGFTSSTCVDGTGCALTITNAYNVYIDGPHK